MVNACIIHSLPSPRIILFEQHRCQTPSHPTLGPDAAFRRIHLPAQLMEQNQLTRYANEMGQTIEPRAFSSTTKQRCPARAVPSHKGDNREPFGAQNPGSVPMSTLDYYINVYMHRATGFGSFVVELLLFSATSWVDGLQDNVENGSLKQKVLTKRPESWVIMQ